MDEQNITNVYNIRPINCDKKEESEEPGENI